jgi:hypothetical protein
MTSFDSILSQTMTAIGIRKPLLLPALKATSRTDGLGLFARRAQRLLLPRFDFRPYRSARCDSKANLANQSEVSPHLIVNFSSTNQRADSFSASGVNLEAKV